MSVIHSFNINQTITSSFCVYLSLHGVLSVLFVLFAIPSIAQHTLKGKVMDADADQPIPFVNIGVLGKTIGTVSDENGAYTLSVNDTKEELKVSAIGYQTVTLPISELLNNPQIRLNPEAVLIPTIELNAQQFGQPMIVGENYEQRNHSIGFGSSQLGTEIAAKLILKKESYIKSAHFILNHAQGDELLFRVNIYDFRNGQVGTNLLPENVIINAKQQRGLLTVDLSEYQLVVDHPVLLSLEWVKDDQGKGNKGITFRSKKTGKADFTYVKQTSHSPLQSLNNFYAHAPKLKLGFYLTVKQVD